MRSRRSPSPRPGMSRPRPAPAAGPRRRPPAPAGRGNRGRAPPPGPEPPGRRRPHRLQPGVRPVTAAVDADLHPGNAPIPGERDRAQGQRPPTGPDDIAGRPVEAGGGPQEGGRVPVPLLPAVYPPADQSGQPLWPLRAVPPDHPDLRQGTVRRRQRAPAEAVRHRSRRRGGGQQQALGVASGGQEGDLDRACGTPAGSSCAHPTRPLLMAAAVRVGDALQGPCLVQAWRLPHALVVTDERSCPGRPAAAGRRSRWQGSEP